MLPVISRAAWGALSPRGTGNALGSPKGVTVHYEGPKMGSRSHDKCAALVRSIQRFHIVTRGWSDIAYNLVVCEHGYVYEGRGAHRGNAANGSTASNLARFSVCALVGAGDATPTVMKDGIRDAIDYLRKEGGAGSIIDCHSDHTATACPGDALRSWVRSGAPRSGAPSKPASPLPPVYTKPKPKPKPAPAPKVPAFPGTTKRGSKGAAVRAVQSRLKARGWRIAVDGSFGPATDSIVRQFQRDKRLVVDGIVGPATWAALWKAPVT